MARDTGQGRDDADRPLGALTRDEMKMLIRHGVEEALSDAAARRFTKIMLETMQEEATQHAGNIVLSGLKKAIGVATIVLAVWMLAGTQAAKSVLGAFLTK